MLPSRAYRPSPAAGTTRIDLVLALFDGAIDRMDKAVALLGTDDNAARAHQARAQLLIMQLASGIDLEMGDPTSIDLLRLYEFCVHVLATGGRDEISSARDCLSIVREGFRSIREEAAQLERSGAIPAAGTRL